MTVPTAMIGGSCLDLTLWKQGIRICLKNGIILVITFWGLTLIKYYLTIHPRLCGGAALRIKIISISCRRPDACCFKSAKWNRVFIAKADVEKKDILFKNKKRPKQFASVFLFGLSDNRNIK